MANLLIVDDDADVAEALAEILLMDGHEVRIAYNGKEGLHLLRQRLPDLVLLDVEMPILDGPEMAYRMFVHDVGMETVPLIILSGAADLRAVVEKVGTPYFLGKPYRYEQLIAIVARALSERTPPQPRRD